MNKLLILSALFSSFCWSQSDLERLDNSPRHHEWVTFSSASQSVKSFLAYPEVSEKATVVIVIHENRGLNDWARSMTDQIAEMGYISLAPDFLSGTAPKGGDTADYPNSDAARTGIYSLDPTQINATLIASVAYAKSIPSGNGKVVVIGFCWGGSQSFNFATLSNEIEAAIVCYGSGPENQAAYKNIQVPVYGFYGGNDNRVNASLPASVNAMIEANLIFEPIIYEGAGHGFFRAGESADASQANIKARTQGLERLRIILENL